jgi:hypothetical protein
MSVLEIEYRGDDLVITREMAEQELGLHLGDRLEIRPKLILVPIDRTPEQIIEIKQLCEALRQAFEQGDLQDWEASRQELWATWKVPN